MALDDCYFQTDRLEVDDWSHLLTGDSAEELLNTFVVSLLSEAVTRDLPPGWQGPYDEDRASAWIIERRSESAVLLIVERSDRRAVGLLILTESKNTNGSRDVRLGYLIDERNWGRGFATEVVAGFADWCRTTGTVQSVIGGVAEGNIASARVLQKNGFVPHTRSDVDSQEEVEYILAVAP